MFIDESPWHLSNVTAPSVPSLRLAEPGTVLSVDPAGNLGWEWSRDPNVAGKGKQIFNGGLEVSSAGEIMVLNGGFSSEPNLIRAIRVIFRTQITTGSFSEWRRYMEKTAPMIREDGPRYFRAWVKLVPWLRDDQKSAKHEYWLTLASICWAKYVDVHWMLIPLICRYHIIICWPKYVDVHLPKLLWRSLKPYRNLSTGTIFQVFNIMYSIRTPWVNFNMSLTWNQDPYSNIWSDPNLFPRIWRARVL